MSIAIDQIYPPSASSVYSPVPADTYKPKTNLINSVPLLYGFPEQINGVACKPSAWILTMRDGANGLIECFGDRGVSGPMNNDVLNNTHWGWGGLADFYRHDDSSWTWTINTGTGKTTSSTGGLEWSFGGNVAHTTSTNRGNRAKFTAPASCNAIGVNVSMFSNGGYSLVAIDGDPTKANGFEVLTVDNNSSGGDQDPTTGRFNATVLAALKSANPGVSWIQNLSTLAGCKYINTYSSGPKCQKSYLVWSGTEATGHTLEIVPTQNSANSTTVGRELIACAWTQSSSMTAQTTAYTIPGTSTTGRTLQLWAPGMIEGLSAQQFLQSYIPSGASAEFNDGNHTSGTPSISRSSGAGGRYGFYGILTNGSANVTSCSNTVDVKNSDKYVAWLNGSPAFLTAAADVSGKTSTVFPLTGNFTGTSTTSAVRFDRADYSLSGSGTASATQALNSTTGLAQGDVLLFLDPSGTSKIVARIKSISGSNVTFKGSVTTVTGMWVIKISDAQAPQVIQDSSTLGVLFPRPYEMIVPASNMLKVMDRHMSSHSTLGTTASGTPARGDTTLALTGVTGLSQGQLCAIYESASTGVARHAFRLKSIVSPVTLDRPLPFGVSTGAIVQPGYVKQITHTFVTGQVWSMQTDVSGSEWTAGDSTDTEYPRMLSCDYSTWWAKAGQWTSAGVKTIVNWSNANADSTELETACAGVYHSGANVTALIRAQSGGTSRVQTRISATYPNMKIYFRPPAAEGALNLDLGPDTTRNFTVYKDVRPGDWIGA